MVEIPRYPFRRTQLQTGGIVPAIGAPGLGAVADAADRIGNVATGVVLQRQNEAYQEAKGEEARARARAEANAEAEEIANAAQAGQNQGVVRTPNGDLNVVQRPNSTSANRAFNAGAQNMYWSSIQTQWRSRFAGLANESQDDPERFRASSLRAIEEAAPEIDASVRGEAVSRLKLMADEHYGGLLAQRGNADRALALATYQRQLNFLREDVLRLAEGGQIGTERYGRAAAELDQHLNAGVTSRFIDQDTRDLFRRETADEGTARALGADAVRSVRGARGQPRTYEESVQALESPDGRPNAAGSGATGPYQIMPFVRESYPPGTSDQAILADLTAKNRAALTTGLGREPTDSDLFLAHRLGAGAAQALLKAPPGASVREILAPIFDGSSAARPSLDKVLEQNPYLRRAETVGALLASHEAAWSRASGQPLSAAAAVRQLDQDLLAMPGTTTSMRARVLAQARSDLATAEGERREGLVGLQQDAADSVALLRGGHEVPPDAMAGFARRARELGDSRLAEQYELLGEVQGTVAAARGVPVPELEAQAQALLAGVADPAMPEGERRRAAALAQELVGLANTKRTQLQADPLTFGARVHARAVGPIQPIDWGNPEAAGVALRGRARQAGIIQQAEGVPVLPLTAGELAGLKARVAEGTPEQRTALLGTLAALGPRTLPEVLQKLSVGNEREQTFAVAAGIASRGDHRLASEILQGDEVLRANPTRGWQQEELNRAVQQHLGPVMRLTPIAQGNVTRATQALYAARAFAGGNLGNGLNGADLNKAVDDITGGTVRLNGSWWDSSAGRIIAPRPGMSQEEFDVMIRAIPETLLAGAQTEGGRPFTKADLIRDGVLVSYRDGQYLVDLRSGQQIKGPDGLRFVLDLRGNR